MITSIPIARPQLSFKVLTQKNFIDFLEGQFGLMYVDVVWLIGRDIEENGSVIIELNSFGRKFELDKKMEHVHG